MTVALCKLLGAQNPAYNRFDIFKLTVNRAANRPISFEGTPEPERDERLPAAEDMSQEPPQEPNHRVKKLIKTGHRRDKRRTATFKRIVEEAHRQYGGVFRRLAKK